MKMNITTNKQKYVSQLPLVNKSILSQGYVVSSVFVDLIVLHKQFCNKANIYGVSSKKTRTHFLC